MKLAEMESTDKIKATRDVLKQLRAKAAKQAEGGDFLKDPTYRAVAKTYTFLGKYSHEIE